MADDEIDFDDLDFGGMDATLGETKDEAQQSANNVDDTDSFGDLGNLDLGDTGIEADTANNLFDDLDTPEDAQNEEEQPEPQKKNPLSGQWQIPLFITTCLLGILNFVVFPASETKENQMKRYDRLAQIEVEKEHWELVQQYLEEMYRIKREQPARVRQTLADSYFALAEKKRIAGEPGSAALYKKAWDNYTLLHDMKDPETDKIVITGDPRFYVEYQIARCNYHLKKIDLARTEFEKLQNKVDRAKRSRLIMEKEGKHLTLTEEIWPDEVAQMYPLAQKRSEILNYLGNINEKLNRLQESILWYKRFAPFAEGGIPQINVWQKIARGYFKDGDIESAIYWYDKIAKEYTKKKEAEDALYELGDLLRKEKRFEEARDRLYRSIENSTNRDHIMRSQFLIGQCYLDAKNYAKASETFKLLSGKYPFEPVGTAAALKQGEILYHRKDYAKAYDQYQKVVQENADKELNNLDANPFISQEEIVNILQNMAVEAFQSKQYTNAENIYSFMLNNFKTQRDFILNKLAEAILAEAESYLDEVAKHTQASTSHAMNELQAKGNSRLVDSGMAYLRIPNEVISSDIAKESLEKAADLFFRAQDWSKAENAYRRYLKSYPRDPQEPKIGYYLGLSLKNQQRLSERQKIAKSDKPIVIDGAEYYFKETIKRHPNSLFGYKSRYELGQIYAQQDEWEQARNAFQDIIDDDLFTPESDIWRDSVFELGRVEHYLGRHLQAVKYLLEALERDTYRQEDKKKDPDPRTFSSQAYLGYSYFYLKKYPEAREQLRKVVQAVRNDELDKSLQRYASLAIADSYVREKNFSRALREYEEAEQRYLRTEDIGWIYFQMGRCYEYLGQPRQAEQEYRQAQFHLGKNKDSAFKDLPENLRKQYWQNQLKWTLDNKGWYEKQKLSNDDFFKTL